MKPPSMTSSAPVTNEASSEARNKTRDLDRLTDPTQRGQRDLLVALTGIGGVEHRRHVAGMDRVDPHTHWSVAHGCSL